MSAEMLEDILLHHELVISDFILEELGRKLAEKFNFPRRDADQVGTFLRRIGIVVQPADLPSDLCRDPTNVPVLGTAVAGECALLISVDSRSSRYEDNSRNSDHSTGRVLAAHRRDRLNYVSRATFAQRSRLGYCPHIQFPRCNRT